MKDNPEGGAWYAIWVPRLYGTPKIKEHWGKRKDGKPISKNQKPKTEDKWQKAKDGTMRENKSQKSKDGRRKTQDEGKKTNRKIKDQGLNTEHGSPKSKDQM